jgi:hypothetical protein
MQSNRPKNGSVIDASTWVGPLGVGRCSSIEGPRQGLKPGMPRWRILETRPPWHPLPLRPGGGGGGLRLTTNFLTISA